MPTEESIPDAELVTSREHLAELAGEFAQCPQLAIDSESDGFYAYREKVCLLQFTSSAGDYIVDPLVVDDLSPLGPVFADERIEKIFHAGEYDVLCLKRDYGFTFANLFDTMIAGRLLGEKELGLAALINKHFGVKLSKKLQRADWGRRPLTTAHLRYAQMDTHYLISVVKIQKELLKKKNRLDDAAEAFASLAALVPTQKVFDPEGFWKLTGGSKLSGSDLSRLRELYLLRERLSEERNRAPFRILPEELMLRLATEAPSNPAELKSVRGMTPYLLTKFTDSILAALESGGASPPVQEERRPGRPYRNPKELKLFEELRQWRKNKASELGIDPVDVVSSEQLKDIARLALADNGDPLVRLSDLKRRRYASELSALLQQAL